MYILVYAYKLKKVKYAVCVCVQSLIYNRTSRGNGSNFFLLSHSAFIGLLIYGKKITRQFFRKIPSLIQRG